MTSATTLAERARQPEAGFNYYRLVQVLLRLRGTGIDLAGARLRLRGERSAAFPGREVSDVVTDARTDTITVRTPNYCVDGVLGPLPAPYSEWLRDQQRDGNRAMGDFLDLFNQELQVLRYRLKAERTPALHTGAPEDIPRAHQERALSGLPAGAGESGLPLEDLRDFAGLWSMRRRSAPVIERILQHVVGVPVVVGQFVGEWLYPEAHHRTRLGGGARLGHDTAIGTRAWDPQAAVALRIGPLPYRQLVELLPGGRAFGRLADAFRLATDRELNAHIELTAQPRSLPPGRLSADPSAHPRNGGLRLGWTAWVRNGSGHGPYRARFRLPAFAREDAA